MRLEVVDRQRVQHVLVVAQIVFAICAAPVFAATWGDPALARQSKPLLAVIGYPSAHDWKVVDHPSFITVAIDRDVHPHVAEAYGRFASVLGVAGEPIYVVMTPHLEPVAAHAGKELSVFLDDIARRWATDRDQLVASAGLRVRLYLLDTPKTARVRTPALQQTLVSPRFDVVGGSFFRTDTSFDKLLADQARYAMETLSAGNETVARSTLDYIISELQDRSGVFFTAQQADSLVPLGRPTMVEGGHYMWTRAEIEQLLGSRLADIFSFHYLVALEGRTTPRISRPSAETRARFSLSEQELDDALRTARQKLYEVRSKRPDPMPHMVVVTEPSALAISALARAAVALAEPRYADAAVRGVRALLQRNRKAGRLFRADAVPAIADDYAALTRALVDTYAATFDPAFIGTALELRAEWIRTSPAAGVPEPVAQLFQPPVISRDPRLEAIAGEPTGQSQIVVSGERWRDDTKALVAAARGSVDDDTLVLLVDNARTRARLAAWMPYVKDVLPVEKRPVAAVCHQRTCSTPTSDPAVVAAW